MFDRAVAICNHRQVHMEQRAAFGHDEHALFSCGRRYLLTLLATWLIIILDAHRTLCFQASHVFACVIQRIDLGEIGRASAINDIAGREDARRQYLAGTLHLRAAKISVASLDGS